VYEDVHVILMAGSSDCCQLLHLLGLGFSLAVDDADAGFG
jgi:hypothetical protein